METKRQHPARVLANQTVSPIVRAMADFQQLKVLYRQGWLRAGVPREQCESVAEHSMGVAMLSLFLADSFFPQLDRTKILLLALLHDFGEIYAGDIVPGKMSLEEKHQLELAAVERVLAPLPKGAEYLAVWNEYEASQTPEAVLVKQVDRLEMAFQAANYEHEAFAVLSDFFDSTDRALSDPTLRRVFDELLALRPRR